MKRGKRREAKKRMMYRQACARSRCRESCQRWRRCRGCPPPQRRRAAGCQRRPSGYHHPHRKHNSISPPSPIPRHALHCRVTSGAESQLTGNPFGNEKKRKNFSVCRCGVPSTPRIRTGVCPFWVPNLRRVSFGPGLPIRQLLNPPASSPFRVCLVPPRAPYLPPGHAPRQCVIFDACFRQRPFNARSSTRRLVDPPEARQSRLGSFCCCTDLQGRQAHVYTTQGRRTQTVQR